MSKRKKPKTSRDSGGFVALPWQVMDSPAYRALSHPARGLLLELCRQYHGDDNGRLLISRRHLEPRGWTSNAVIHRAKMELLEAGFIFQTVEGWRPNKASWFALTFHALDRLEGFDPGAAARFERSAYLVKKTRALDRQAVQHYTARRCNEAAKTTAPTPPDGAMEAAFGHSSTPSRGHPLDMPSPRAFEGAWIPAGRLARAGTPDRECFPVPATIH